MAVACGDTHTGCISETGAAWCWGLGHCGQLGLDSCCSEVLPQMVANCRRGRDNAQENCPFGGARAMLLAAGRKHTAAVTDDGCAWTWGYGGSGRLGHGDREDKLVPTKLGRDSFSGFAVLMVACGAEHTVVLGTSGWVWTFGDGLFGRLGHGDEVEKFVPTRIVEGMFSGSKIVMVAAGRAHTMAVSAEGAVFAWGSGGGGRLGVNDEEDRLVPALVSSECFSSDKVVLVAGGGGHSVAVGHRGQVWTWGHGDYGELGLGDRHIRLVPTRLDSPGVPLPQAADTHTHTHTRIHARTHTHVQFVGDRPSAPFGGSSVVMAACGCVHTVAVTDEGGLWTWGHGGAGALGHDDFADR